MRLYRTTGRGEDKPAWVIWTSSEADAGKARHKMTADGLHRKDVETVPVEVPTDKLGLIAFLNGLAAAKAP